MCLFRVMEAQDVGSWTGGLYSCEWGSLILEQLQCSTASSGLHICERVNVAEKAVGVAFETKRWGVASEGAAQAFACFPVGLAVWGRHGGPLMPAAGT
mmetsp:Transcript_17285/g.26737  ORF Transcript_17285/g.26737 Transcript_17285/m.26737 type:complete len:98 (-) Transcript_17285:76-369(-)